MDFDSYEKASLDILSYLKADPEVLVLDWVGFNYLIYLATGNNAMMRSIVSHKRTAMTQIVVTELIPNIFSEIQASLPYPDRQVLRDKHFVTELIGYYGEAWIPVGCPDYGLTLKTSFLDNIDMVEWQRYLRAYNSKDKTELTVLSVDPSEKVREQALRQLKTL